MPELAISYLGVAGWSFKAARHTVLIDPYFTRLPLWNVVIGRARPDLAVIAAHTPSANSILITHPHYDHLMDVPEVARLTGARVAASPQGCDLLHLLGVPADQTDAIHPGDSLPVGPFLVEVFASRHRRILGSIPYQGPLRAGLRPSLRAREYRMDGQFSFRITGEGVSVLVASGIEEEPSVAADVLFVGADASEDQLRVILNGVHPKLVLPNHWDDMFRPLSQPTRPMIVPPPTLIPRMRRIDLGAWQRMTTALAPNIRVIIPNLFEQLALHELLA